MVKIKSYEFTDQDDGFKEENLSSESKKNIQKIFEKYAFKGQNHLEVKYQINEQDNSILLEYLQNKDSYNFDYMAKKMYESEMTKSGKRSQSIRNGNLLIYEEKSILALMKLEKHQAVEPVTYKEIQSFGIEHKYYKVCILKKNPTAITIIDKNLSVAKYWYSKFLGLKPVKSDFDNTIALIELIETEELFSEKLRNSEKIQDIKKATKNYIFENDKFDKLKIVEKLVECELIEYTSLEKTFSDESQFLDSNFTISKTAIKHKYHQTLQITKDTKITTDNFSKLKDDCIIEFDSDNDRIILNIPKEFIQEISSKFGSD